MTATLRRISGVILLLTIAAFHSAAEPYLSLGPMLGHVGPREANIWVDVSEPAVVTVQVGIQKDLSDAKPHSTLELNRDTAAMGTARITGLKPDTRYYYAIAINGKRVTPRPYPHFTTTVQKGEPARTRVAFTSCFGTSGAKAAAAWAQLAANAEADLILLLGDNHYADSTDPDKQRRFYFSQRDVAGYREATQSTPTYAIWDDHDYGPNNSDRTAAGKEKSLQTFKEHWANPAYGEPDNPGVYYAFQRGRVQFIMLDDRYHRDPNNAPASPDKTMLGEKQKAWLKQQLKASDAAVKLVALGSEWQLNGHGDSLTSFKHEQKELLDFMSDIPGVILLSGDRHFTGAYQIGGRIIEITAGPMGSKNYPTKNLPDMFMNRGEGKLFAVLDIDTRVTPPKVVLEVHRAGDAVVYEHELTWDEINGDKRITPLPEGK